MAAVPTRRRWPRRCRTPVGDAAALARVSPLLDEVRRELVLALPAPRPRDDHSLPAQLAAVTRQQCKSTGNEGSEYRILVEQMGIEPTTSAMPFVSAPSGN